MKRAITASIAGLVLLAGCSAPAAPSTTTPPAAAQGGSVLDRLGVSNADAVTTINALDQSTDARPLNFTASVRADKLVLKVEKGERSLPIPADKFYLSIAPYLTKTHDCFAHSLSGCQGEQVKKPMHITITDSAGKTLVDQDVTTYTNGFVGFWLPRDVKGYVTATMDGKKGTAPFSTAADAATCLTTLQMR